MFEAISLLLLKIILAASTILPSSTFSIGYIGNPTTFLPTQTNLDGEKTISNIVFRKLFKYEEGELINDLVENWEISEDKTEYRIKIKDAKWQDGNPITSDDILYSITNNPSLRNDVEIEKLDNKTVLLRLPTPNAILPSLLTFGIQPAHLNGQSPTQPIGSSSYRIARIIREQNKIESVILQSYAGNKKYNRLIFNFYDNENDLQTAYKLGEIDAFLSSLDFTYDGLKRENISFLGRYFSLIYNTKNPKLVNPELRQTLSKALDINNLLSRNYYLNSTFAQGPISNSEYTKESLKTHEHNPDLQLTQAEKTTSGSLQVILPNNQDGRQIETFLDSFWGDKLEIDLEYIYMDLEDLINAGKEGTYEVIFIGHEVTPDPDRYIFWHSTQGDDLNLARFEDLRADKALEEGRKEFLPLERSKHYNIFQDVMETKVPAVFLYHPGTYFYHSENKDIPLPKVIYYPSEILNNL